MPARFSVNQQVEVRVPRNDGTDRWHWLPALVHNIRDGDRSIQVRITAAPWNRYGDYTHPVERVRIPRTAKGGCDAR